MKIKKGCILLCTCLTVLSSGSWSWAGAMAKQETEYLHLPEIIENEEMSTGQETIWSCLYFGAYPAAEIVTDEWNAVDDYAIREGDIITDNRLFRLLSEADWNHDTVTLEGKNYVRINSNSAVTAAADREQHYRWEDPEDWHYFLEEPLRWRVLSMKEGKALLLADRVLDCAPFNLTDRSVAWDTCTLRSWLNGYGQDQNADGMDYTGNGFLDRAFTDEEQKSMVPITCITPDNQDYGTDSGADTIDKVFLLSNEEVFADAAAVEYGFYAGHGYDDPAKRFSSTMYAKCRGTWWSPVAAYKGNSFWFMRTSGSTPGNITYICDFGYIYSRGTLVTCDDAGLLPAICIDLEKADYSYAGEVSSRDILRDEADESLPVDCHNPVITEDEALPGGKNVTWSRVSFGTYPQTEILGDSRNEADGQEVDPVLWELLQQADWDKDETRVNTIAYRRLNDRYFRYDPVVWRVLEVKDGTALLLSEKALDCFSYHSDLMDVNWKDSAVRSWLNSLEAGENLAGTDFSSEKDGFYHTAFTEEEQKAILTEALPNAKNHYFGTFCGTQTFDRVFLLSEDEIFSSPAAEAYGFQMNDALADLAKRFIPTAYAQSKGAWKSDLPESKGNGFWILRSNGYTAANVVYVGEMGHIYNRGIPVTCKDCSIVPAIRIDLESADVTVLGDISSKEKSQDS
ncbi:MAG: hypothetical protein IKE58_02745 [Blautia sp.]|nr:hypothetical protein [Blautia sp.]